ncbi:alpha/beta fold hydrolase [Candidatus Thorarchaeota archaeon]|nr:MAG: alpha/beta fold hydrolase [Candidatus Thorarchaeota archaeon]
MTDIEVILTSFTSNDETLHGNFVKPSGDGPFPGICKFHGLPGSSDQVHGIAMTFAEKGFLVLTFDFRGFRESEGFFSLSGEIDDAKAAVTHLLSSNMALREWVGVYGASFGGAVAVCSAAVDDRIKSVCVRAPVYDTEKFAFSDLAELVLHDIAFTAPNEMHGVRDLVKRRELLSRMKEEAKMHNPMKDIGHISPRPLFITTGDSDILIDVKGVRRLYEHAKDPKEMVVVKGADHNLSRDSARRETERGIIDWFMNQTKNY